MGEALRLGTQDARLLFHAGMIAHARGEHATARVHLERALRLNPHFHLLHAELAARTLASIAGAPAAEPPGRDGSAVRGSPPPSRPWPA